MDFLQDLRGYRGAFGASDGASDKMKQAIGSWFAGYYDTGCLALPYTIVRKLTRGILAEYETACDDPQLAAVLASLPAREALQLALVGGECYLKPILGDVPRWQVVARPDIWVFRRDIHGEPVDVGMAEESVLGNWHYTLLERRTVDGAGNLTICNRLFRSASRGALGREVSLKAHPMYADLPARYVFPQKLEGVGLVRLRTPMINCVDGSGEGVSIYAAAMELIRAAEENETQLQQEFRNGQSRLVVSRDLLDRGQLKSDLFVALDDSPDAVGITVFAPQLREQSYLNRQQSYLRAVENVIGLKRGLLSQVEAVDRTATEITSSEGEYMVTLQELRLMWEQTAREAVALWSALTGMQAAPVEIRWGDGVV